MFHHQGRRLESLQGDAPGIWAKVPLHKEEGASGMIRHQLNQERMSRLLQREREPMSMWLSLRNASSSGDMA
jgi:hypothetical protein